MTRTSRIGHPVRLALLPACVALALAGCAGTGGTTGVGTPEPTTETPTITAVPEPSATTTETASPTAEATSPAATASPDACTPFGGTKEISSSDPQAMTDMTGDTMRVGRHACFERFVFQLQGTGDRPGWTVGYRTPLAGQASGLPIKLRGDADLEVIVQAWTVTDFPGRPAAWLPYRGPDVIVTKGFVAIKEARNLFAYEGATQLGLGIDQKRAFRVQWLNAPARLVVDVYTGVPAS